MFIPVPPCNAWNYRLCTRSPPHEACKMVGANKRMTQSDETPSFAGDPSWQQHTSRAHTMRGWTGFRHKFAVRMPRIFRKRKCAKAEDSGVNYEDYCRTLLVPLQASAATQLEELPGLSDTAKILRFLLSTEDDSLSYDDVIRSAADYDDILDVTLTKRRIHHHHQNASAVKRNAADRRSSSQPGVEDETIFPWEPRSSTRGTGGPMRVRASEWIWSANWRNITIQTPVYKFYKKHTFIVISL